MLNETAAQLGQFWNRLDGEVQTSAIGLAIVGSGFGAGELTYHFSGVDGDSVGVSNHLNAEINNANADETTAQNELNALRTSDGVYKANHLPVPKEQATLEQIEAARVTHDKTTTATLTHEIPHVPLSEGTADFSGIGLAFAAVFAIGKVRMARRRAAATSQA